MRIETMIELASGMALAIGQAIIGDDGIGAFEYWGTKGFDMGKPCIESLDLVSVCLPNGPVEVQGIEYAAVLRALGDQAERQLESIV